MEDRNCNCKNNNWNQMINNMNLDNNIDNCDYEPTGINAAFGINSMCDNTEEKTCCGKKDEQGEKMLERIRCLSFAITDLAEYLNTHMDDRKAICLHREYCNELRSLKDKYQKVYGPLSIYFPCNSWRWLEEPWPWEGVEE